MCEHHGFFWMCYEFIYHALEARISLSGPAAPDPPEEQTGQANSKPEFPDPDAS